MILVGIVADLPGATSASEPLERLERREHVTVTVVGGAQLKEENDSRADNEHNLRI